MNAHTKDELRNGHVEVPTWVMAVTYVFCWTWATAIMAGTITGWIGFRPLMVGLALYLLFWPVFQTSPRELLRRLV